MEKNIIEIKEEVKIPEARIILEVGDRVKILENIRDDDAALKLVDDINEHIRVKGVANDGVTLINAVMESVIKAIEWMGYSTDEIKSVIRNY